MKSRKVVFNDSTLLPKLSFYLKACIRFGLFFLVASSLTFLAAIEIL